MKNSVILSVLSHKSRNRHIQWLLKDDVTAKNAWQHLIIKNLDIFFAIVGHFGTIQAILCMSFFLQIQ